MEKFDLEEERKKLSQKFEEDFERALSKIAYDRIKQEIVEAIDGCCEPFPLFLMDTPKYSHSNPNDLESFKQFRNNFLEATHELCEDVYVDRAVYRPVSVDEYKLVIKLKEKKEDSKGFFSFLFD